MLALKGLGISAGDKVATQAFTCEAVPEAISATGATPVFVDIGNDDVNMCPVALRSSLIKYPDIKLVILQYTYGCSKNIVVLSEICAEFGIPYIEDCCHLPPTPGDANGYRCQIDSVARFYSVEWGKPVALGIGGVLVVNDGNLIEAVRKLANHLSAPPIKHQLLIEIQFLVFSFFVRLDMYIFLKKMFRLLSKFRLIVDNSTDQPDNTLSAEIGWLMCPRVKKRLDRFELPNCDFTASLACYYHSLPGAISVNIPDGGLLRYPIRVSDKASTIENAARSGIHLGDWYSSPIDPYDADECLARGWNFKACSNAISLSKSVITISHQDLLRMQKSNTIARAILGGH